MSPKFKEKDKQMFDNGNYEDVRDKIHGIGYVVSKNRRYRDNIMACVGTAVLAGKDKVCGWFVNPDTGTKSPLPRPYAQNRKMDKYEHNPTKYEFFCRFVEQAEIFVLKHLLEVHQFDKSTERRKLLKRILRLKRIVPKSARVCNSIFTQLVVIGDGQRDKNISGHKDQKDLVSVIITFGHVESGGSTQYLDDKGLLLMDVPFMSGRIQVGCYDNVYHKVPQWKGERTTFNLNVKKQVLEHFEKYGQRFYKQFEDSGYKNGFVAK